MTEAEFKYEQLLEMRQQEQEIQDIMNEYQVPNWKDIDDDQPTYQNYGHLRQKGE